MFLFVAVKRGILHVYQYITLSPMNVYMVAGYLGSK